MNETEMKREREHEDGARTKKHREISIWCIIKVELPGLLGDHIRMREGEEEKMRQTLRERKNNFKAVLICREKKSWSR